MWQKVASHKSVNIVQQRKRHTQTDDKILEETVADRFALAKARRTISFKINSQVKGTW